MSIYSNVNTGTKVYRSRFHRSISFSKKYDCRFGEAIPVLLKFVLPGDVWRIGGDCLVRFQPQVAPSLTPCYMKVRYFFVPLRLLEPDTELITTGSQEGHLYNGTLPEFKNFVADADKVTYPNAYKVTKYSFWDYAGVQVTDYENFKTDRCLPAQYFNKAYHRVRFDYYDDENIGPVHGSFQDFDSYYNGYIAPQGASDALFSVELPKDYFTSALPWQLKAPGGIAPVLDVTGTASFTPNFDLDDFVYAANDGSVPSTYDKTAYFQTAGAGTEPFEVATDAGGKSNIVGKLEGVFNQQQSVNITGLGFNADELRTMMAQTRIFERLARCGSRYTEYLRANFGIAPADGTLQRAQYLGGWKLPVVTTEVLQTAADGANPVGTMRGHGITRGGNRINAFFAKEFGVLIGIAHIMPQIEYTQGCPREFSYKSRFDFFNPSFQHLSEQEIRNGEIYIAADGLNDTTFGFQAYGNELRTSVNMTVADMRDSLKYWNQSVSFGSRPNLSSSFIQSDSYRNSFNQTFAVNAATARPCIVQFYNDLDVYRPMVKYSTPGLVDHL